MKSWAAAFTFFAQPHHQAAEAWIINNQMGRRNLTAEEMSYLRGRRYNGEKKQQGGDRKSSGNSYHMKTAEKLAKEYKVSEKTIRNDGEFAEALDQLPPPLKEKVLTRDSTPYFFDGLKSEG